MHRSWLHLYEKGSTILHMVRRLLGEDGFWRSMNVYLTRHRTKGVETIDLIEAIQDATGKNMRPFFDQWIFKAGHPEYKVRTWWDAKERKIFVRVLQAQATNEETGLFSMPVTFAFHVRGEEKRFTETVEKKEHLFSFSLPSAPELALFDPDHTILKKLDFTKPETMWMVQLSQDPHVLGRIQPGEGALGPSAGPTATQALRQALQKEKFWGTQSEIARALGKCKSMAAMEALLEGLRQISHPKVRRALFEALGNYSSPRVLTDVRVLYESEKSYFAQAEAIRTLGRMRDRLSAGCVFQRAAQARILE